MNAVKVLRELKALDELEARVKALKAPDQKVLAQIAQKREELLKGAPAGP